MTPARKKINSEINTPVMLMECKRYGVNWNEFNPNSYRLTKYGFVTVDYFPSTGKLFFHDSKEWGETPDIKAFIEFQFSEEKRMRLGLDS